MLSVRHRLLLLLVLVSVVTAVAWSPVLAHGAKSKSPAPEWTSAGKQPLMGPTSGEPDVGQGPKPSKTSHCMPVTQPASGPQGASQSWFRWILRIWISTTYGAR